ncbi:MAG: M48 family metallopeptidase [Synergistaceae bacterium]|nr:M48 family metallopeptidase [Synergistaceae bacterium]
MQERITVNSIDFELRRNSRRKHIAIGIIPFTGGYYIAAPSLTPKAEIKRILSPDIEDIINKILVKQSKNILPNKKYHNGEKFFYKGVEYPLVRLDCRVDRGSLQLEDGAFRIRCGPSDKEREIFEAWYKRALHNEIQEILPIWTKRIKVNPSSINIKTVRSIWGSCSSKRSLTFSTRLALVPFLLMEYVVAHELCHLRHMNHSNAFWEELSYYIPDCKERRKNLKNNGHLYRWW